jgi:surface polysaccharide O-acyltransferase-like enzyme
MAGVYLLIPLLQRIAATPSLARYFVILTGTASVLLPTTALIPVVGGATSDLIDRVGPYLVAGYPFYFVLGHLLHEHGAGVPRWVRRALYVAAGLALAVIVGGTAWLSLSEGRADGAFYGYLTLGVVTLSTAIFLAFRVAGGTAQTSSRLALMARWTLPIYLIHPAFVRVIQEFHLSPGLLPAAVGIPVIWLAVLALSVLASAALVKIPWVNRWLV